MSEIIVQNITKSAQSVSTFKIKHLIQHRTIHSVSNGSLMEKCLSLAYDYFLTVIQPSESITPAILLIVQQNLSTVASGRATHHRFMLSLSVQAAVVYLSLLCNFNSLSVWMLAVTDCHCLLNCLTTFSNALQFQQIIKHKIAIASAPFLVLSQKLTLLTHKLLL